MDIRPPRPIDAQGRHEPESMKLGGTFKGLVRDIRVGILRDGLLSGRLKTTVVWGGGEPM
jgi:hypothetical protein